MKKRLNKQAKKASKQAKAENLKKKLAQKSSSLVQESFPSLLSNKTMKLAMTASNNFEAVDVPLLEKINTIIPIILAADDNYAPFMYSTMLSILENAHKNTFYDFYLMVPSAFSHKNEKIIMSLKNKYNCNIHFLDMEDAFSDLTMHISHITSPTYYRLLAGDLLPKEYDKCIYLDVDICVCQDLCQLYNIDMGNNYIAGVVAAGYYFSEAANCRRLNLPSMKTYVNAGVLLMNLKQIRQDNMTKKFVELSKKNYSSQDQDVVNIACYGKIITLPPKYNAMTTRLHENKEKLREIYKEEDIIEARNFPCIIHYADKIKPWNSLNVYMGNYWWDIVQKSPVLSKIFKRDMTICYNSLLEWYQRIHKKKLNLDNPKTFNEKIQWMKLYDSTPIKTRLADKYLVRDWVKEKIGEEYLIPLLGVYDKFEDINFDKLPNRFVIKCNHGCAYNIIVKDKSHLDLADTKTKLNKWLNENFSFKAGLELHYRDIKPKIIIEKFIENKGTDDLYDYKFWCFNGKVEYIQFLSERNLDGLKMAFYDRNWVKQSFVYSYPFDKKNMPKPDNLDLMIKLAEKLAQDFPHVRVDFYRLNDGKLYFGEMTFTSASGNCKWTDERINQYFGSLIKLPKLAYNIDTGEYYKLPQPSKIKPYLLFPYYLWKLKELKKQNFNLHVKHFLSILCQMRVDIKNVGKSDNAIIITAENAKILTPSWFTNTQGIGQVVSSSEFKQNIKIKTIQSGKLTFNFRGIAKKDKDKKNLPLWCDYKSIKIDGKKINDKPIQAWHDVPFKYEIPVKNGQVVNVEIEQFYHKYTKEELKRLLPSLLNNSEFNENELDILFKNIKKKIGIIKNYHYEKLKNYPRIVADCFIPIGTACRPAFWLKTYNLRYCSLPFDWMTAFSLSTVISTIKNGVSSWFEEYNEDTNKKRKKTRYVTDVRNQITSLHAFPIDKSVDEYMPVFKETFTRRYNRMINMIKKSKIICFICNERHEIHTDFYNFITEIQNLYPHKKWILLHVKHSDTEHSILKHQYHKNITIYNILAYDINEEGNNRVSNDNFWKGNTKTWKDICSHLSLAHKNSRLSAFKHFLYHKVKTDTYTKTYICGIRVKRKAANIYDFIDKRLATLSNNWEKKFEAVVNAGAENKKALSRKISTLDATLASLSKESNLIKSNSLYMIKSLNDKMAEVMSEQAVNTQTLQIIQAENTAEILESINKLPENIAQNSAINKKEITESIKVLGNQQQKGLDDLLNNLKQYYVSRTKTDNYSLEFRTFADIAHCIRQNLKKIPNDVDLVVGVPRSGMIPAYIIALFMNKKCCSLDEFLSGSTGSNGIRAITTEEIKKVLIVDDSVYNGTEMERTREKLAPLSEKYSFIYTTVYVKPDSEDKVDIWMEKVSAPRVWQWNYLNHSIAQRACFDMDGVLCIDPTADENDDGERYLEFMAKTKPLYIPTYEINTIVTSRLEKYREQTEKWLKDHGVKYKQLIMLDLPTAEERRKLGCHAKFKAEIYKKLSDTVLFVESEPKQAREIALLTGKTVICTSNDEVY